MITEKEFREKNKDCYIPNLDFSVVHREYAALPEYLRRWCYEKHKASLEIGREE